MISWLNGFANEDSGSSGYTQYHVDVILKRPSTEIPALKKAGTNACVQHSDTLRIFIRTGLKKSWQSIL